MIVNGGDGIFVSKWGFHTIDRISVMIQLSAVALDVVLLLECPADYLFFSHLCVGFLVLSVSGFEGADSNRNLIKGGL